MKFAFFSNMASFVGNEKRLLFTSAVLLGVLLGHTSSGRIPNVSSIGPTYSPTRTWAFFLLPGSILGRVGSQYSQTKQNIQGRSGQDSSVVFASDVNGFTLNKDKPKDEQTDKSQVPIPQKDTKLVHKNTLLRSVWVIIAIMLMIILCSVAVYHWILFYPILCKKERKYDVMQMSAQS